MGNNTASEEEFEVEKVEGGQWVKWTVPLVLLILVLALVTAAILSERPRTALDNRNIVLCVLTALLCTLVAVSLTLMGCAESSSQTEQHLRSVAAEVTTSRDELLRLGQAGLRGSEEVSTKTSRLEENQRLLRDKLAELKNAIETEHNALRKTAQGHKQELAESIGAVTLDQQTMHTRIDGLQQAGKLMSEKITLTADNQESLRGSVQEQSELLGDRMSSLADIQEQLGGHVDGLRELMQTVAGDVTNVAREQATLHEAVETRGDESVRRLETLSEDHTNVHNHLDQLGENVKQASAEAAEMIVQRVAIRESFQAHAEALEAQMSGLTAAQERLESSLNTTKVNIERISAEQTSLNGTLQDNAGTVATTMGLIEQFQHTLQDEISNLAQVNQRMITSIEAMTVEQASLRETTGTKNDELTGQIAAFSEDQKAALAAFGEDLQQAATGVASIARDQDHIEKAVSATCRESLGKLDAITNGREHWGRQLEANEAQVNTMVTNIGNLQEQVAAVLEMLNTCVQGLTDVLDSNNKHQFKLEDTVNQNLTTIAQLISQIKANRACLEDQM